jgi:hypothetical protein
MSTNIGTTETDEPNAINGSNAVGLTSVENVQACEGRIDIPADTTGARYWEFNDNYHDAQSRCTTAEAMWDNLEVVVHDEEEHITLYLNVEEVTSQGGVTSMSINTSEIGQHYNGIKESIIYYDWYADSATSTHVTNKRDIFTTFEPLKNTNVVGVGRNKTKAEGRGNIELRAQYGNNTYILKLQNVLYIPTNRNNLLSLGRWDAAGGKYVGGQGQLTLKNKEGNIVAKGPKIANNLYKMKFATRLPTKLMEKSTQMLYVHQTVTDSKLGNMA